MYNFEEINLENIIVHSAGNKAQGEELVLSDSIFEISEEIVTDLLLKYFLSPFKDEQFYNFFDEEDLAQNIVYSAATKIFENPESFYEQSTVLAKYLYEQTNNANIKGGEFYMVFLTDCVVDGEFTDAVGVFKSENKDTYMKVYHKDHSFKVGFEKGININKLDKGCLILNTEKEEGYKVCIVDTTAKNNETARYWKDDFLKLTERHDNFYHTKNYMNICKSFVDEVYNSENNVDRPEQMDVLNKTVNYFKENQVFNETDFETSVMQAPEIIDAFKDYKQQYIEDNDVPGIGEFDISDGAVKSNQKFFKSILKLDKNFHVYVHGNRDMIERGFDDSKGLRYYRLFYREEG